jgi:hypothetical protein
VDQGSSPLKKLLEVFLKTRNPCGSVGDYPYEVPVWNLSPITFQAGSFIFPRG